MKIFDFKNPSHVQILREEIQRTKRILREYNESNEWSQMPEEWRRVLLLSADANMGSDFADEYVETDWMKIPDSITNRIDISKYTLPTNYAKWKVAKFIEQNIDMNKLDRYQPLYTGDVNHAPDHVIDILRTGNPSRWYTYKVLTKVVEQGIQPNMDDFKPDPPYRSKDVGGSGIGAMIQMDKEAGRKYYGGD
jgi:hypothetical protein